MILRTCPSLIVGVAAILLFHSMESADAATPPPAARPADYQPSGWKQKSDVNASPKQMTYKSEVQGIQGQNTLRVNALPVMGAKQSGTTPCVGFTCLPVGSEAADSAGITFEYQGDGSMSFGSVFVGTSADLLNAHEAFFPLGSTGWQTATLRWSDFVNNALPWDKAARLAPDDMTVHPVGIKFIGFGRSNCNYKFHTPKVGFAIRNIRFPVTLPANPVPVYSKGLSHTTDRIRRKDGLNILMLGDSITDMGGEKNHGWHCAQLLRKKFGLPPGKVANAGISGQTVRFGTIGLPRALRLMPNPDLVCIMFGANDCKAATGEFNQSGFNQEAFARNLSALVDQVRRATGGKADIVLLSGVPRLDKSAGTTTGAVETIVGACQTVAVAKETAFCDTFPAYLELTAERKASYYKDTVHQSQAGLAFLGQLLSNSVAAAVQAEAPPKGDPRGASYLVQGKSRLVGMGMKPRQVW